MLKSIWPQKYIFRNVLHFQHIDLEIYLASKMTFLVTNPMTADGARVCTHSEIGNEQLAKKSSPCGNKCKLFKYMCAHF